VDDQDTVGRVKEVLRESLRLGAGAPITDDMSLVGGDYDLDSLDILAIVTGMEKEFGIKIPNEAVGREAFSSVATLSRFVDSMREGA